MKKKLLITILILLILLVGAIPAFADDLEHNCKLGETESVLQALPVGYFVVNQDNMNVRMAGLGGGIENCQYRLFLDGQTFTFQSSDYILGGTVILMPYKDLGLSREEGIAEINKNEIITKLGPVDGELVEMDLTYTSYKDIILHGDQIVYQGSGFITQLEPGEYKNYTEFYYQGELVFTSTVYIIIEP